MASYKTFISLHHDGKSSPPAAGDFLTYKIHANALAAGALPQTPLGELTAFPRPQAGFREGEGGEAEGMGDLGKMGKRYGKREGREERGFKGGMGVDPTNFGRKSTLLLSCGNSITG